MEYSALQIATLLGGTIEGDQNVLVSNYSKIEEDFIKQMNKLAKKIGMVNSVFKNPSGLDNETSNITTAYDMAILTSYSLNNDNFIKFFSTKKYYTKFDDRTLYYHHKHRLVQNYDFVLGGKTGVVPIFCVI